MMRLLINHNRPRASQTLDNGVDNVDLTTVNIPSSVFRHKQITYLFIVQTIFIHLLIKNCLCTYYIF